MPAFKSILLYLTAFFSLHLLMMECHEQVHLLTGYLVCGCYGERNFNVWSLCEACRQPGMAWLVSLSGPVFTYGMVWLGWRWYVRGGTEVRRNQGFALLFANLPFARVFTALTGRGDEKTAFQHLAGAHLPPLIPQLAAVLLTVIFCLLPIIFVYRKMRSPFKGFILAGFVLAPMIAGMLYSHRFLNGWLARGILAQTHFLGTPDAVLIHACFMLLLFGITRHALQRPPFDIGRQAYVQNAPDGSLPTA